MKLYSFAFLIVCVCIALHVWPIDFAVGINTWGHKLPKGFDPSDVRKFRGYHHSGWDKTEFGTINPFDISIDDLMNRYQVIIY